MKAVAQPGPCVGDPARVLDRADPALERDGLQKPNRLTTIERNGRDIYVLIQDRVLVLELPEHQGLVRLGGRVEGEEYLAVLLDRQMLDLVQPIWIQN